MARISVADPLLPALLVLTFATGIVDAISFLGLGHVFVANMLLVALALEATLVVVAIPLSVGASGDGASARGDVVIAVLAVAMGIRNAAVRRLRVPDITTTILTMTLTGLVAESPLGRGSGARQGRRAGALVGMFLGALVGGLLVVHDHRLAALALLAAVLVMCLVVAILHPALRRPGAFEA